MILEHLQEQEFDLGVTIFVGIDLPDQASIFSTVNLNRLRKNKLSLVCSQHTRFSLFFRSLLNGGRGIPGVEYPAHMLFSRA